MAEPPVRNYRRFRLVILAVVAAVQAPGVAAVAHLSGQTLASIAGATALSLPYLFGLKNPFEDRPKSVAMRYLGLWPFFAWWASCLAFLVLGPIALGVAALGGFGVNTALAVAGAASLVTGLGATYTEPRLRELEIAIPGLPEALDGYRIAQISDVHCGSYTPPGRVARWVRRLNRAGADLIAVTGDLITSGEHWVETVADALAGLAAPDGVYACMGNHDYFVYRARPSRPRPWERGEEPRVSAALKARGLEVLRNRGLVVERDGARLYVAGVDDTWTGRADLGAALADRPKGVPTLLLAHDPNLFPQAAAEGVELTLSGHTHGGQIAVPGLARQLTLARLITRFTAGLYHNGRSALYVSRGAGTTGPPLRLGARGELTILTLRAA